jgi:quercetin dioxygenase-like cupin family protein
MKYPHKEDFEKANLFGLGAANTMFAQYFLGDSFLNPLVKPGDAPIFLANVTFEPGCRNNWHIHHASSGGGQMLICTAGEGWYQEEGHAAISLKEGSVVYIPAGKKHWHGAKADSWFSHIAFELPGTDTKNEWLEPVSKTDYDRL